jgi:hypothetical protein
LLIATDETKVAARESVLGGSAEFRAAHRDAGQNKPLYIDHPQFEGFEVRQTVRRGAAAVPDQRYAAALYRLLNSNGCLVALRFSWNEQRHHLEATEALADYLPDEHGLRLPLTVFVLDQDDKTHQKTFQSEGPGRVS